MLIEYNVVHISNLKVIFLMVLVNSGSREINSPQFFLILLLLLPRFSNLLIFLHSLGMFLYSLFSQCSFCLLLSLLRKPANSLTLPNECSVEILSSFAKFIFWVTIKLLTFSKPIKRFYQNDQLFLSVILALYLWGFTIWCFVSFLYLKVFIFLIICYKFS